MSTGVVSSDALGRLALGRIANTMRQQPSSAMCKRKYQAIHLRRFISKSNLSHVLSQIQPTIN